VQLQQVWLTGGQLCCVVGLVGTGYECVLAPAQSLGAQHVRQEVSVLTCSTDLQVCSYFVATKSKV